MKFAFPGLNNDAVKASREQHGSNEVTTQEVETFWDKFVENFKDPIILILVVALVITVTLSVFGYVPWYEGIGIAIAVALATLVATWSEYSNENEFQKLLAEASMIQVKVFRNNHLVEIPIDELVVGDYILLQPGDTIPVDGVLVASHLEVDEAALTGESEPVKKYALPAEGEEPREEHKLFRAALVDDGEAVMKATAVGDQTEYGKTLKEITGAEDRLSPLQEKLSVLGGHISTFGYIGATFIFMAFMYKHAFLDANGFAEYIALPPGVIISHLVTALVLAIIIIVVAVPEGLPMMIAIVLSLNMRKLLNAKVLVRKLLGIETAGSLTILFTDKTGTLTQGRLVVEKFLSADRQLYDGLTDLPDTLSKDVAFALRNNTSAVVDIDDPDNLKIVGADRTEKALLEFVGKQLAERDELDIVEVVPFNSSRKFSAMQVSGARNLTLVKGAPEIILENCTHCLTSTGESREFTEIGPFRDEMYKLSKDAMRLIALAVTEEPLKEGLPGQLTLLGVFGIRDGLRKESYEAVAEARDAGIHVVMITGDAKETAEAIARDVGLMSEDKSAIVLSSKELNEMSDDELKENMKHLHVVARAFPTDKSRLVRLAKEMGWVVGMTGDGVNDAPAVKNADVGFSMGSGTEMTKESSDIVILDDNFSSLTRAVLYGRTLFKSIRKFLIFQLTVNVSAILLAFLGPFMGFELPLTMIQLLWINLIMDTLAALAFSGEAALKRYMHESPIPKDASLINNEMWASILTNGLAATALCLWFLTSDWVHGLFTREDMDGLWLNGTPTHDDPSNNLVFLTAFFGFFVFMHNFNKFNARTESINLFDHLLENKNFLFVVATIFGLQVVFTYIGGEVLRVVGLTLEEWGWILLFATFIIPVDLCRKLIRNLVFGNPVKNETYQGG